MTDICVPVAVGSEVEFVFEVEVDRTKGASRRACANVRAFVSTGKALKVFAIGSKCGRVLGEGRFKVIAVAQVVLLVDTFASSIGSCADEKLHDVSVALYRMRLCR